MSGDAKTEGQALSVAPLSPDAHAAFERIIGNAPKLFSVNDIRERLDIAQIPDRARGGLFARAVAAGLIAPYCPAGFPARVQSTGPSAHRATVVLYQRLAVKNGPRP
jgi:hypothetical protein